MVVATLALSLLTGFLLRTHTRINDPLPQHPRSQNRRTPEYPRFTPVNEVAAGPVAKPMSFGRIAEHQGLRGNCIYVGYNARLFATSKRFCLAMIPLVYFRQH
jgi:hypothetical protein